MPLMNHFDYDHLPVALQSTSAEVHALAWQMFNTLPECEEKTAGLRKLLEAKDCFVRAAL